MLPVGPAIAGREARSRFRRRGGGGCPYVKMRVGSPTVTMPTPLVLLVEDDRDLREAMSELIEAQGVDVRAARDGREGLEMLKSGLRPHAVFLDQCMPRLDGASVLAAMSEDPALAAIPVVWMSGERRTPPPPVTACLPKPFEVSDLRAILATLCRAG